MENGYFEERRKHRRYIVRGRVKFTFDSLELWGDLVNFGDGGMLLRTRYEIPEKTKLNFCVVAYCYPDMFAVPGQVVGGRDSLLAIRFLERTDGVMELLRWLEVENFPWTGGISYAGEGLEATLPNPDSISQSSADETAVEASMEDIFQNA